MHDESCDGCIMFVDKEWCTLVMTENNINCPCRSCLIKVMCRVACEEYERYVGRWIDNE